MIPKTKTGQVNDFQHDSIMNSINLGRPVLLSGYSERITEFDFLGIRFYSYSHGHAWVIDGARLRARTVEVYVNGVKTESYLEYEMLLHCNYGWDARQDGYYNSGVFNTNIGAGGGAVMDTRSNIERYYQYKLEMITHIRP